MFVLDKENLEHELRLLKQDMARIDAAINSLLPVDKDIVTLYYVDGLRWRKIARKVNYTVITCIKKRDKAIWYMSKSLFGKWKVV
jgi:DNA-directed RNA polymerase specialized sigma24 family protein